MISFFLPVPMPTSTPQGKRMAYAGGRIRVWPNQEVARAKSEIALLAREHKPDAPLDGPVILEVEMTWPWRVGELKSNIKKGCLPKTTRPDVDNSVKLIIDGLTDAGFWLDDAQIVALTASKYWGTKPGVKVSIHSDL